MVNKLYEKSYVTKHIKYTSMQPLYLFITGGAGVGKSFDEN